MANQISRRSILQGLGIGTVGTLAACDGVELPGISAPDAPEVAEAPASPSRNCRPRRTIEAGAKPASLPSSRTKLIYNVRHTEEEWRARLSPDEYSVLREGATEPRHSHYLTRETAEGIYNCQGCDLPIYSSEEKTILDIGWVFFQHALPDSVLLGVDGDRIEAHCRRCGSHIGHILYVETEILHCVNGTALDFIAA